MNHDTTTNTDLEQLLQQAADLSNRTYSAWKASGHKRSLSLAYNAARDLYDAIASAILEG
mgnify:CR=1 FL=1